jgi:hypothetical protein
MPSGFQTWTDSGFIQVDSDLGMPNWQLRQKLTVNAASSSFQIYYNNVGTVGTVGAWMTQFVFSAVSPLVAFTITNGAYFVPVKWTINGNNYVVDVVVSGPCSMTAYIFDRADQTMSGNNFGAQVFNAAGQCVADVTVPFARILGSYTDNLQFGNGATGWFSGGGNEPPKGQFGQWGFGIGQAAVAAVVASWEYTSNVSGVWMSMFNTNGGTITGNNYLIGSGSGNNYVGFKENLQWAFTAVDVSNY